MTSPPPLQTEIKAEVEAKSAVVKEAAQGEDVDKIRAATEALGQVIQKIGASAYQAEPAPEAKPGEPGPQEGPDVVDGEAKKP